VLTPRIERATPLEAVLELSANEPVNVDGEIKVEWLETPVGPLLAGASESALVLLEFSERSILQQQLASVRRRFNTAIRQGTNRWLEALQLQLDEYFSQRRQQFELPLAYPGTAFQERVWSTLLTIPYGQTWSYLEMARALGDIKATRAVGTANGMNRIAIIIPCHRVINANGKLGGYGGGLWRKQLLLDLERGQRTLV
jgi:AraC family transcriptional regulator of adaptative response/methylated-DNA-[protein]-cysteine methyltransferase